MTKQKPLMEALAMQFNHNKLNSLLKSKHLMHYNRIIFLVILTNIIFYLNSSDLSANTVLKAVLVNFFMAMIVRQHYLINLFFLVATSIPHWVPLKIRAFFGKVYHFGGFHVGGAISAIFWYVLFLLKSHETYSVLINAISLVNLVIMVSISLVAFNRHKVHDLFERLTRFGSWSLQILVMIQSALVYITDNGSLDGYFVSTPFILLFLLTINIILPWLRLKKVPVKITTPSNHVAIAEFDYGVTPFAGSSTCISLNPLFEWHSFANIPTPNKSGYRLAISRAGDWTGNFIDSKPEHVWVKAIPTAGVGNIEKLFKKVIFVATGSGIGPCLPHLLANKVPSNLIWSTRSPEKTYGKELVNEIKTNHKNALIWDTDKDGKPDLLELAYQMAKKEGAEAVIFISNKKLTWKVVSGLEERGVHAYGAIFDS